MWVTVLTTSAWSSTSSGCCTVTWTPAVGQSFSEYPVCKKEPLCHCRVYSPTLLFRILNENEIPRVTVTDKYQRTKRFESGTTHHVTSQEPIQPPYFCQYCCGLDMRVQQQVPKRGGPDAVGAPQIEDSSHKGFLRGYIS